MSDILRRFRCPHGVRESLRARLAKTWSTDHYNIEYRGFLSNHLAHGVIALEELGDSDERIDKFVDEYTERLEPPSDDPKYQHEPSHEVREFDTELLGARLDWYGLLGFYRESIVSTSAVDTIRLYFPRLSAGLAGSALHGLIQLGYGCKADCERLVAEGLAYMHHSYLPFPANATPRAPEEPGLLVEEMLEKVREDNTLATIMKDHEEELKERLGKRSMFQVHMYALSEYAQDEINKYTAQLALPEDIADGVWLLNQAITVYANAVNPNDFFLLHGVTGAWSLQQVLPLLSRDDAVQSVRDFVNVLLAVYVAQGQPPLKPYPEQGEIEVDWDGLCKRTLAVQGDEHVYKLVQVCMERAAMDELHENWPVYERAIKNVLDNDFTF